MTLVTGPNLGQLVHGDPGEEHYAHLIKQWRALDALVQARVKSASTTTPPAAPADGDCYIVPAGAAGGWVGHVGSIARWSGLLKEWEFYSPQPGWMVWVIDAEGRYQFDGAAWAVAPIDGELREVVADLANQVPDGRVYGTVGEGIAAVADNQQFWVRQPAPRDGRDLYRRTGDVAVYEGVSMAGAGVVADVIKLTGREIAAIYDYLELDLDNQGRAARGFRLDGTTLLSRVQIGEPDEDRVIETSTRGGVRIAGTGGITVGDGYSVVELEIGHGKFAGATYIECDPFMRVRLAIFADGSSASTETGGGSDIPPPGEAWLVESITLPDGAQAENPNGGYTVTGADRMPNGIWITGNHGYANSADSVNGAPSQASIVLLNPDCRRIFRELPCNTSDFPGIGSIQGVAFDTSDNTIWFVDKANKTIRHITVDGLKLQDEIVVEHTPNGLAYDPVADAVWSPGEGTNTAYLLSCTDGSVIRTISVRGDLDQMFYDADKQHIYYTHGGNGSDGTVRVINALSGATIRVFSGLRFSQAIEGVWADGKIMTVFNDGAYHTNARPPLALANQYRYTL